MKLWSLVHRMDVAVYSPFQRTALYLVRTSVWRPQSEPRLGATKTSGPIQWVIGECSGEIFPRIIVTDGSVYHHLYFTKVYTFHEVCFTPCIWSTTHLQSKTLIKILRCPTHRNPFSKLKCHRRNREGILFLLLQSVYFRVHTQTPLLYFLLSRTF